MGKTAVIFPGQGSQVVGMGADIYESFQEIRDLYSHASEILGFDLTAVSFKGPVEDLRQTRITQPALFVHSFALFRLLKPQADMFAGHSLGEFTAFTAAAAMDFDQGLKLVKVRGQLMQKAGVQQKGTMAAIIGLDYSVMETICQDASAKGVVVVANVNAPTQIVISGSVAGVHEAMRIAEAQGAKRAIALDVSGAFHSPLMQPAQNELTTALAQADIRSPRVPVYCNVTAIPCTNADLIRSLLEKQLTSPVLWTQIVEQMIHDGTTTFIEIGAGSVLTGLVRRINREVEVVNVNSLAQL